MERRAPGVRVEEVQVPVIWRFRSPRDLVE